MTRALQSLATPSRMVSADEFGRAMRAALALRGITAQTVRSVTGPGRSGALAAVYASHWLGVPFVPCDLDVPAHLRPVLVIDTAMQSGRTLRRAERQHGPDAIALAVFNEPPRVRFWFETAGQWRDASRPTAGQIGAWARLKGWLRHLLMWRTVVLLEQVDNNADDLRHQRDVEIPRAFSRLAAERDGLVLQLSELADLDDFQPRQPTKPIRRAV